MKISFGSNAEVTIASFDVWIEMSVRGRRDTFCLNVSSENGINLGGTVFHSPFLGIAKSEMGTYALIVSELESPS